MSAYMKMIDERLSSRARAHTFHVGHHTIFESGIGWLCEVCDEDFEQAVKELGFTPEALHFTERMTQTEQESTARALLERLKNEVAPLAGNHYDMLVVASMMIEILEEENAESDCLILEG